MNSTLFEKSGVAIIRTEDFYFLATFLPNGLGGWGGHAHNDLLSFCLWCGGTDFIVDPGSYVYTPSSKLHRMFRSTSYHNTIKVDDEEIKRFIEGDFWGMHEDANSKVLSWDPKPDSVVLEVAHNGYQRLPDPVLLRRKFILQIETKTLKIIDRLHAKGLHRYEWNFHFGPGVELSDLNGYLMAQNKSNSTSIRFISNPKDMMRTMQIGEYWFSRCYGTRETCSKISLRVEHRGDYEVEFELSSQIH